MNGRGGDQIALPLDWPQSQGESRLIISDANRAAFEHFRKWSLWPVKATLLTGPRRSGRTLLARNFADRVSGRVIDRGEAAGEEEVFNAWKAALARGRPLVLIVDRAPPEWEIALPDLRTRVAVTPVVTITEPDDSLFQDLIDLHFADRGLHIPREALKFMTERLHRDYWTIERAVESVDRFAISERARLSLPTIRRALIEAGMIDG